MIGPTGLVGVTKGSEHVAAAENQQPPTAHPLVGDSMKIEVKLALGNRLGVPLTVTKFHVPTPPLTV
jgi:hypothetical protein